MSTWNPKDIPRDRPSTMDETGARLKIHPADVRGKFRNWRNIVYSVLIVIFLALPWVTINGHQALLLDIAHRRFSIFGLVFWAHEAPLLFFIFAMFAFSIAFVTAIWGRLWCGWACPQTVFIDAVFRRIERWVEGDSVKRRQLDAAPLGIEKIFKRFMKWSLFLVASLVIAHSFLAYFVGTGPLGKMMLHSPLENLGIFLTMCFIAGVFLFDFGWFREQFCIIMCPYGRFQSVMMDESSLAVHYDSSRNDCVNCYRCVQVCPTGIDIRRGLQMECVACTACIDACDDVMTKVKRPLGLIRYDSELGLKKQSISTWRPRTFVYTGFLVLVVGVLTFILSQRKDVDTAWIRAIDTPYQQVTDVSGVALVINHYRVDISNKSFDDIPVSLSIPDSYKQQGFELITQTNPTLIEAGKNKRVDLFIRFPRERLKLGKTTAKVLIQGQSDNARSLAHSLEELTLVGPY